MREKREKVAREKESKSELTIHQSKREDHVSTRPPECLPNAYTLIPVKRYREKVSVSFEDSELRGRSNLQSSFSSRYSSPPPSFFSPVTVPSVPSMLQQSYESLWR